MNNICKRPCDDSCFRSVWTRGFALVAIGLLSVVASCSRTPNYDDVPDSPIGGNTPQKNHLVSAMETLDHIDRFQPKQAKQLVLFHLNLWGAEQKVEGEWTADPQLALLPKQLTRQIDLDWLTRTRFDVDDMRAIRDAMMMRTIVRNVRKQQREWQRRYPEEGKEFARLSKLQPYSIRDDRLGENAAQKLQLAAALFDWTVRNIRLDLMPNPSPYKANVKASSKLAPAFATPGTRLTVWETLLLGHGDALERAKVFVRLARQAKIDVVLLHPDEGPDSSTWLAAVMIEDHDEEAKENKNASPQKHLYLFDLALGLPVPGPQTKENAPASPITTWKQIRQNPSLLRALDITVPAKPATDGGDSIGSPIEYQYPITKSELGRMIAWIDAPPVTLSRRMQLVESRLSGKSKVVLTVDPSSIRKWLRTCDGIADVRLWTIPYETRIYHERLAQIRKAIRAAQRDDNQKRLQSLKTMYDAKSARTILWNHRVLHHRMLQLFRGRMLQLQGKFVPKDNDDESGARPLYLRSRWSVDPKACVPHQPYRPKKLHFSVACR